MSGTVFMRNPRSCPTPHTYSESWISWLRTSPTRGGFEMKTVVAMRKRHANFSKPIANHAEFLPPCYLLTMDVGFTDWSTWYKMEIVSSPHIGIVYPTALPLFLLSPAVLNPFLLPLWLCMLLTVPFEQFLFSGWSKGTRLHAALQARNHLNLNFKNALQLCDLWDLFLSWRDRLLKNSEARRVLNIWFGG